MSDERKTPMNEEAEKALLGCVFLAPAVLSDAEARGIDSDKFFNPAHQALWSAVRALVARGLPLDFAHLIQYFGGNITSLGGPAYITEIQAFSGTAATWAKYAEILLKLHDRRELILAARRMTEAAYDLHADNLPEIIAHETQGLLAGRITDDDFEPPRKAILEFLESVEKRQRGEAVNDPIGFGIKRLDKELDGMSRGSLVVIAAPTSVGKSALALQAIVHACEKGFRSALLSLEMSRVKLTERLVAHIGKVSMTDMKEKGGLSELQLNQMTIAAGKLRDYPYESWFPRAQPTAAQVATKLRALKFRFPDLRLAVVDYLQLLGQTGSESTREREVAAMSATLKRTAESLAITVIAMSQLNKDGDVRESSAIEHDADIVLKMFREPRKKKAKGAVSDRDNEDHPERYLYNDKNRDGRPKTQYVLHFNGDFQRFHDITNTHKEEQAEKVRSYHDN